MSQILLIDDSADTLLLQKMFLELEGHEVVTANSAQDGLRILNEMGSPDLILLDVQMPHMPGPEMLELLERTQPALLLGTPVVLLTAQDEPPVSNAAGFIHKMSGSAEFIKKVSHYLN